MRRSLHDACDALERELTRLLLIVVRLKKTVCDLRVSHGKFEFAHGAPPKMLRSIDFTSRFERWRWSSLILFHRT